MQKKYFEKKNPSIDNPVLKMTFPNECGYGLGWGEYTAAIFTSQEILLKYRQCPEGWLYRKV